jgi:hypothetical protein
MNLKALKALAVAGPLVVLAAAGCTNLTEQPKSTVTAANVFNDPGSYQALLARVYAGLAVSGQQGPSGSPDIQGIDEGFSQYMRLYWECEELPTDEAVIGWGDIGLPEMNTMTWNATSPMVVAMYYRIELQAAFANEFLRQTTDAALAARGNVSASLKASIQQWRAEARFLRALSYWHGLDLFGNIPLVTENDPIGGTPPKQASRADIYNFVVSELTDPTVANNLPAPTLGNYGRATTGAANMLLAELYLNDSVYTGTTAWTQAANAATSVIGAGYTLDPSYAHLFEADNNTSPEIIFPVEANGNNTQTWGNTTFLIHAACGGSMSAANYGMDYCWGGTRLKPEAYHNFGVGDNRGMFYTTGQTDTVYTIGSFNSGIALTKWTNKTSTGANGSNPTFVDTDFPMFRLAEAYLIRAEALLRSGGSRTQALADVNLVRERAYGGVAGDITDAELTLPFILAERGRELLWEAHRRTDLVRYGLFTGGTYLWSWKGGVLTGKTTDSKYDLYPLPANELAANPNLTQNPGY